MEFKSLFDFQEYFKTDNDCLEFLKNRIFPNGVCCIECQSDKVYQCEDKLYKCSSCKKRFSIRTGTIFENSRIPLKKWFLAMYLLDTSSKGISSVQMAKQIGVTQNTAWSMMHRIRQTNIQNKRELLAGDVEIDETYVGGKEKNKHANKKIKGSQGGSNKEVVVGSIQRDVYGNKKIVKAEHVENAGRKTLKTFIDKNIHKEAVIISDDNKSYGKMTEYKVKHSQSEYVTDKIIHTNNIENFWGIFKRGYVGVYHFMSKKHLQKYINEYCFRYNHKEDKNFSKYFTNIFNHITVRELKNG